MTKESMPQPTPWWELPAVVIGFMLLAHLLHLELLFGVALGTAVFLQHYVEDERRRWRVLVDIVINTNLGALELEQRVKHLEDGTR